MFRISSVNSADISKILAISGRAADVSKDVVSESGGSSDLVFPHDTYVIGLDALKKEEDPVPERSGTRVMESSSDHFSRIFDLHNIPKGEREAQMLIDAGYISSISEALSQIFGSDLDDEKFEVRLLRIPALYVDALWLHKSDNPIDDLFIAVQSMKLFEKNKLYDKSSFYKILKDAAKGYELNDDLLGA
jgi:hypothetical protein